MEDNNLQDAFGAWEELSQTKEKIFAYESRLKYILEEDKVEDAKYLAEKGREEGLEKSMKTIARKLIEKGKGDSFSENPLF